ncbi:hypothetical protein [Acetobacter thailandicus]|uniref:hypothetical protein n=1 Tax=Acetobacter thailandicus TaxID=1502842 RepID=UPI001BAC1620|nr:hypothetical protein [Acetobacter thailandicus]MBS0980824.1 hypothetical protein [Acetobacter thailandicus]
MAIRFFTSNPTSLLALFNQRIAQTEQKGKITTWVRHSGDNHYTHISNQWRNKAFLKPTVYDEKLVFNIIAPEGQSVSVVTYGFYHGHIIETFLNHFDDNFERSTATSKPTEKDMIKR